MASVSSASTTAQVRDSYDDNASYVEDNSIVKARRFVTAARILLRRTASQTIKGANQITLRPDLLEREIKDAQLWLEARDVDRQISPSATRADFRKFR